MNRRPPRRADAPRDGQADDEDGQGPDRFPEPPIPLSRGDLVLVRKAVKGRWRLPDAFRRRLMARLGSVIASDLTGTRNLVAVGKLLKDLDALNMEQERRDEKIPDYHEHTISATLETNLAKVYGRATE